jgi:hypothetical protein
MHVTLMRAYVMIEQLLAISRRSTSKYTRKGLTFSVFIVTFKPDWCEGGKDLLPIFGRWIQRFVAQKMSLDGQKVTKRVENLSLNPKRNTVIYQKLSSAKSLPLSPFAPRPNA